MNRSVKIPFLTRSVKAIKITDTKENKNIPEQIIVLLFIPDLKYALIPAATGNKIIILNEKYDITATEKHTPAKIEKITLKLFSSRHSLKVGGNVI